MSLYGMRRAMAVHSISVFALLVVVAAAGCQQQKASLPPIAPAASVAPSAPSFSHIFVIMMENRDYEAVIGSDDAPYINQLAKTYGLATSYYGIRHPSLPNYLALISGSTQGVTSDCPDCGFDARNLADQFKEHGKSWRAYEESMPAPCFNGPFSDEKDSLGNPIYARKHNPWMYFKSVSGSPEQCGQVVPLSQFDIDVQQNRVPDFVWIAPNVVHDMHDGTIQDGDSWLASFVPKILESPAWKDNGVLFILWDEGKGNQGCCGGAAGGHIPALVISPLGKPGYRSGTPYTHYSLLRTIEDAWQLGTLGEAGAPGVTPLSDFFR